MTLRSLSFDFSKVKKRLCVGRTVDPISQSTSCGALAPRLWKKICGERRVFCHFTLHQPEFSLLTLQNTHAKPFFFVVLFLDVKLNQIHPNSGSDSTRGILRSRNILCGLSKK